MFGVRLHILATFGNSLLAGFSRFVWWTSQTWSAQLSWRKHWQQCCQCQKIAGSMLLKKRLAPFRMYEDFVVYEDWLSSWMIYSDVILGLICWWIYGGNCLLQVSVVLSALPQARISTLITWYKSPRYHGQEALRQSAPLPESYLWVSRLQFVKKNLWPLFWGVVFGLASVSQVLWVFVFAKLKYWGPGVEKVFVLLMAELVTDRLAHRYKHLAPALGWGVPSHGIQWNQSFVHSPLLPKL